MSESRICGEVDNHTDTQDVLASTYIALTQAECLRVEGAECWLGEVQSY